MLTNEARREILNRVRASGFPGGISEALKAAEQGVDVISQFEEQQAQQQEMQMAQTQQEQETGLRDEHAAGNTGASMAFPNTAPNQSFNTVGMKAPIDIQKVNDQGHLVESYKNVPPGIQDLPTGPHEGTVIESPAAYQKGGFEKQFNTNYQESQNYQRIKNSRKGSRYNPPPEENALTDEGSYSTHLMADDEKNTAWPTLFQNKDGSWFELSKIDAYKEAKRRGEIYKFDSKKELTDFARKGDWKNAYKKGGVKGYQDGSWWDDFKKSKTGKFVDAKGFERMFGMDQGIAGQVGRHFGYESDEGKDLALDAAAILNPAADFVHAGTKLDEGKYTDAALYAGFGILPFSAGPLVRGTKKILLIQLRIFLNLNLNLNLI